jgi:hypothetical protein
MLFNINEDKGGGKQFSLQQATGILRAHCADANKIYTSKPHSEINTVTNVIHCQKSLLMPIYYLFGRVCQPKFGEAVQELQRFQACYGRPQRIAGVL